MQHRFSSYFYLLFGRKYKLLPLIGQQLTYLLQNTPDLEILSLRKFRTYKYFDKIGIFAKLLECIL